MTISSNFSQLLAQAACRKKEKKRGRRNLSPYTSYPSTPTPDRHACRGQPICESAHPSKKTRRRGIATSESIRPPPRLGQKETGALGRAPNIDIHEGHGDNGEAARGPGRSQVEGAATDRPPAAKLIRPNTCASESEVRPPKVTQRAIGSRRENTVTGFGIGSKYFALRRFSAHLRTKTTC